jgi:predicted negative regulator of RcsB-dependent stress response
MAEHHLDRKELKGPDAFFENVGRFTHFYQENRNRVFAGAGAVVLAFLGVVVWSSYSANSADKTAAAFMRATDAIDLDALATAEAALKTVASKSGGTYHEFSLVYMADLKVREGQFAEALPLYGEAAEKTRTDYIRQIALVGKAFCLESTDKAAEAAATYASAAGIEGPYQEPALRGQLRTATSAMDKQLAASAIKGLLESYPESPDAEQLTQKLTAFGG